MNENQLEVLGLMQQIKEQFDIAKGDTFELRKLSKIHADIGCMKLGCSNCPLYDDNKGDYDDCGILVNTRGTW